MAMTMLQMAGATPTPATMADGILLIVDAQREYTDGLLPLTGVAAAVEALTMLLEKARKAGAPVVHVRTSQRERRSILHQRATKSCRRLRRVPERRSSTRDYPTPSPVPTSPSTWPPASARI